MEQPTAIPELPSAAEKYLKKFQKHVRKIESLEQLQALEIKLEQVYDYIIIKEHQMLSERKEESFSSDSDEDSKSEFILKDGTSYK